MYKRQALDDLREIYSYIANELLAPETATAQLGRIRKEVRSLDFMPARYALVDWEPWHSMKMHHLPVDNFIVYYLVDDEKRAVTVGTFAALYKIKQYMIKKRLLTVLLMGGIIAAVIVKGITRTIAIFPK